jgi:hypothetical protein
MAYVRKTQELLEDVRKQVREMKDRELTLVGTKSIDSSAPIYTALRNAIQEEAWHIAPSLRTQMPKEWCTKKTEAYVTYTMPDGAKSTRLSFQTSETDPMYLPPKIDNWRYECNVGRAQATPELDKWYEEASNREKQAQEIAERYATIDTQLNRFLDSHASLNAALKEMPQLEMYIPQKYMDKFRAASAPRSAPKAAPTNVEELGIDRDALAAAAIAHRIATSGSGGAS